MLFRFDLDALPGISLPDRLLNREQDEGQMIRSKTNVSMRPFPLVRAQLN